MTTVGVAMTAMGAIGLVSGAPFLMFCLVSIALVVVYAQMNSTWPVFMKENYGFALAIAIWTVGDMYFRSQWLCLPKHNPGFGEKPGLCFKSMQKTVRMASRQSIH